MAIILHRFPYSHYAEKARALLDFKGLDYRIVDHTAGPGQIAIYRLSGQRKVPIIEHDGTVVADSTEIALYLERVFPDRRRLLPEDPEKRHEVLALEDRLDTALGGNVPFVFGRYVARDKQTSAALGTSLPPIKRALMDAVHAGIRNADALIGPVGRRFDKAERIVRETLADLTHRLETSKYLVGNEPSLADVAAVGLSFLLKAPPSRHLAIPGLAAIAVPGIADAPAFARFFDWREQFYRDYLH
jgi:glutathione S-transferase